MRIEKPYTVEVIRDGTCVAAWRHDLSFSVQFGVGSRDALAVNLPTAEVLGLSLPRHFLPAPN